MRFNIYKEARISLYVISAIMFLFMVFYFVASMITSMGYEKIRNSLSSEKVFDKNIVILDAGHGGEDPGAVANGLTEKTLNLDMAFALKELFVSCGYDVVMTRNDDVLLYNQGENNKKKYHDLKNRALIAEKYENSVFISLHMNQYPAEYCKGLQVFYSTNTDHGKALAESIQSSVKHLQTDNKRTVKDGTNTIFLLENIKIPSVLVECGFLSNKQESKLLKNQEYFKSLALSIYCGTISFTENYYEN